MAEPTTSAALPSDPMAAFAAEWSPKLQATKDYPTAAEPADVVQQHAQVAQLQSDFLNAASIAGLGLVNYPGVKKASDDLTRTLLDLDSSVCALATPKSVQAFTCATQNLSAKWGAQTLGLTLVTAARS